MITFVNYYGDMMPDKPYRLVRPQLPRSCVVFSSPHSGDEYPAGLLARTRLDSLAIRSSEDAFVDRLFADAPAFGAPLLAARFPRAYVDLNRAPDELDPALVRGVRRFGTNPRIAAGLGVIPRVVGGHRAIRSGKMSLNEARRRIDTAYTPFHKCLRDILTEQHRRFGLAILIDCHSMPQDALNRVAENAPGPDIIIGDCFGTSASAWITESVVDIFSAKGFSVARNKPFSGGYITKTYGRPSQNIHAVQVEINRALYMDEATICPNANFAALCKTLSEVTQNLTKIGCPTAHIAAE